MILDCEWSISVQLFSGIVYFMVSSAIWKKHARVGF